MIAVPRAAPMTEEVIMSHASSDHVAGATPDQARAFLVSEIDTGAQRAILVLGMHRSGTSAITRVLNLAGAFLPGPFAAPAPDNETGHWESTAVVAVHDEL